MCYVYAHPSCKFTRRNKSQPKHKTIIEDLDIIIQDFKTVRLGLQQNRYTALTSKNVQTRLWFISAAVASVKFLLFCAVWALLLPIEDLFAYKDYKQSLFAK